MKKGLSIRHRMLIIIFVASAILSTILGSIVYSRVGNLLINISKRSGLDVAITTANSLNGDMFESITSEDDVAYKLTKYELKKYTDYKFIKAIYTLATDGTDVYFVIDMGPVNPAYFHETYDWQEGMKEAFSGDSLSNNTLTNDRWGTYYSSFAPIVNSKGEVVGIVGVDTDFRVMKTYLNELLLLIVVIVIAFCMISILLYFFVSRDYIDRDELTELYNQDKIIVLGEGLAKRDLLTQYNAILVNIKDFKYINKKYSYETGNVVLKSVAKHLKSHSRRCEFVARTGNDNFFCLIKKENFDVYLRILENFATSFNSPIGDIRMLLRFRCGIYTIDSTENLQDIISKCSVALTMAKGSSLKNDIIYYSEEMYSDITREKDMIKAFRYGIDTREFKVYYQPKVDVKTNKICGAEALVRWVRNGQVIPPYLFIPLLEKEGLINELDLYVFDTVCFDIVRWKRMGVDVVPISSNFSKNHLYDVDFAKKIIDIANRNGTESKYLDVELTESSGYSNIENLQNFISKMKEAGIKVSIDDFGTGYSSLSMLGSVKCDIVKIDKSFVDKIFSDDEDGAKMVKNVIHMIKDLGREVICEGVETKEQVEFLSNTDCDIIQGYFFDKPLSVIDFERRLLSPIYNY